VHGEIPLAPRMPSLYVDRVLTSEQINEFAERGFVLVPQVVQGSVLARAAQRIDEVVAADAPAADKHGNHFSRSSRRRSSWSGRKYWTAGRSPEHGAGQSVAPEHGGRAAGVPCRRPGPSPTGRTDRESRAQDDFSRSSLGHYCFHTSGGQCVSQLGIRLAVGDQHLGRVQPHDVREGAAAELR
jgi:hypothetical protein